MEEYLLVSAALLPAILLAVYVFKKDKIEKEPLSLLVILFCLGALSCIPAGLLEEVIIGGVDLYFFRNITHQGKDILTGIGSQYYDFIKYFFGVALIEEGLKWLILRFVTFKSEDFNCLFDGMIYAIFVSLGFAAFENVGYVLMYGWSNAIMRAVLSVPGHMFFAVMMGYHYSRWNILRKAAVIEEGLAQLGKIEKGIKPFNSAKSAWLSIIVPVLLHGTYNFCCSSDIRIMIYVFAVFVLSLYIYCFSKIRKFSRADDYNGTYVERVIKRKYSYVMLNDIEDC